MRMLPVLVHTLRAGCGLFVWRLVPCEWPSSAAAAMIMPAGLDWLEPEREIRKDQPPARNRLQFDAPKG
jgi:hypothetical protein